MRTGRTLHPLYKIKEERENLFGFSNVIRKEKQTNNQRKSCWIFELARKEQKEETKKERKEKNKSKPKTKIKENVFGFSNFERQKLNKQLNREDIKWIYRART